MNAPKEYYPVGYDKNYDDNFKSKVDLPVTAFHCGDQRHFPGLYGDEDLGCMVSSLLLSIVWSRFHKIREFQKFQSSWKQILQLQWTEKSSTFALLHNSYLPFQGNSFHKFLTLRQRPNKNNKTIMRNYGQTIIGKAFELFCTRFDWKF